LLIVVIVVIEKSLALHKAGFDNGHFMVKLKSLYRRGDAAALLAFCSQKDAPIANIVRRGVLNHGQGDQKVRAAVENAGKEEIFRLGEGLGVLSAVAGIAPMLGFLGTAINVIVVLRGVHGGVTVAGFPIGIGETLLATAFGLSVGIFALLLSAYFLARVRSVAHDLQVTSTEFLELLEAPTLTEHYIRKERKKEEPRVIVLEEDEFFRRKS
jgi:biopolymer transport protein ExbB